MCKITITMAVQSTPIRSSVAQPTITKHHIRDTPGIFQHHASFRMINVIFPWEVQNVADILALFKLPYLTKIQFLVM